jgi:hypothetical protein
MAQKYSVLKIGLLIVVVAYLLFNAHSLFNLNWWGEWERLTTDPTLQFYIYIEDIFAGVGIAFRFIASIIAFGAIVYYFRRALPSTAKLYRILKFILFFEAIYWFGLSSTAGVEVYSFALGNHSSVVAALTSLMIGAIPAVMEAIVLPIMILLLAFKLNPSKPVNIPIKWGLITGTIMIFVFWLTNSSIWFSILSSSGWGGITNYLINTVSFVLTVFGLLVLAIYSAIFTVTYCRAKTQILSVRTAGIIILAVGLFFLWEYLSWIIFDVNNNLWSFWYAWFLGHNLDLWMLALPLIGLPMMFYKEDKLDGNP